MAMDIGAELALVQRCAELAGGKFREEHFRNPNATETRARLVQIAFEYASNYNGSFEWMLAKRGLAKGGVPLSAAEIAGILNCLLAASVQDTRRALHEARKAVEVRAPQPALDLDEPAARPDLHVAQIQGNHVPDGTYTVVFDSGCYETIRVQMADEAGCEAIGQPPGSQFVGYLSGPDNTSDYQNIGDAFQGRVRIWKKYRHLDDKVRAIKGLFIADEAARRAMGVAYARQSGNCYVCHRKLTTRRSLADGIGPKCAGRV